MEIEEKRTKNEVFFFLLSIKCSKFSTLCILTSLAGFESHSKHSNLVLAVY